MHEERHRQPLSEPRPASRQFVTHAACSQSRAVNNRHNLLGVLPCVRERRKARDAPDGATEAADLSLEVGLVKECKGQLAAKGMCGINWLD